MIKVALAFDNTGSSNILRDFFQSCAADFKIFLDRHEKELIEISGADLNHDNIERILGAIDKRFVFVSFSHGKHDSLICSHNPSEYVSLAVNFNLFRDSFFYTWSCLSSLLLGHGLTNQYGCSVYWGYKEVIWAPSDSTQHGIFIQCANRGIQQFIAGSNVQESRDNALEYYNEKIDELADISYPLSARLRVNRDAMDVQGNMGLTIADFRYETI